MSEKSISKEEALDLLIQNGYNAVYEDGMPIIYYQGQIPKEEIASFFKEINYSMSYGLRCRKI